MSQRSRDFQPPSYGKTKSSKSLLAYYGVRNGVERLWKHPYIETDSDPENEELASSAIDYRNRLMSRFAKNEELKEQDLEVHLWLFKFIKFNTQPKTNPANFHSILKQLKDLKNESKTQKAVTKSLIQSRRQLCENIQANRKALQDIVGGGFKRNQHLEDLLKVPSDLDFTIDPKKFYSDVYKTEQEYKKEINNTFREKIFKDAGYFASTHSFLDSISGLIEPSEETDKWSYHLDTLISEYEDFRKVQDSQKATSAMYKLNVVTANLGVKMKYKKEPNLAEELLSISIPIFYGHEDENEPCAFGWKNLNSLAQEFVMTETENAFNDIGQNDLFKKPKLQRLSDSEKVLLGSLKQKKRNLVKNLMTEIGEKKVTQIDCIWLEVFSTRECCASCELFLTRRFPEIYDYILEELMIKYGIKEFPEKMNYGLEMYFSYSLQENPPVNRSLNEDNWHFILYKTEYSYFDFEFLRRVLAKTPQRRKRTFFVTSDQGLHLHSETELLIQEAKKMNDTAV